MAKMMMLCGDPGERSLSHYVFYFAIVDHIYGLMTFSYIKAYTGRCLQMSNVSHVLISQTWNSNGPRLFRYRLCKYSTFVE